MRRRAGWVVGVVVGTALLAGCSDAEGDADPGGDASSPGGGASSESSGPTETAEVPVVPELPAEALGDDDAAAVAFVEHWVDLVNYALETGDTAPATSLAAECSTCRVMLADIEENFDPQRPGSWIALETEAFEPRAEDASTADSVIVVGISTDSGATSPTTELTFGVAGGDRERAIAWVDVREL